MRYHYIRIRMAKIKCSNMPNEGEDAEKLDHSHIADGNVKRYSQDFPGGAVVKNPPANAGDMGLSPGPGRSHMPWSN